MSAPLRRVALLALLGACSIEGGAIPPDDAGPRTRDRDARAADSGAMDGADGDRGVPRDTGRDGRPETDSAPRDSTVDTFMATPPRTCQEVLATDPGAVSGPYVITPRTGGRSFDVYCDMDTDGGGWTLVVSSRGEPPSDSVIEPYADLATLDPSGAHIGVAGMLRPVITARSDARFACRSDPSTPTMQVDLSFYDVDWYRTITSGTDIDSCFSERDGAGYDRPAPARRNNIDGATRPVGDDWDRDGYLEGEDSCGSLNDFTVDFDDRGMDSDQSDLTDWGDDDDSRKCGIDGLDDGIWYLFVRE